MMNIKKLKTWINSLLFVTAAPLYAQVVIVPNVNRDAKELQYSLNETKDSLKLRCDHSIRYVRLTANNFSKIHGANSKTKAISINSLPVGHITVTVYTNSKLIVFNLLIKE